MTDTVQPRRLLLLAVGFAIWASALVTLYGVHAVGCAFGWPPALLRGSLVTLLAIHIVALAWIIVRHLRRHRSSQDAPRPIPFIEYVGVGAAIAALAATLFTFAPSFILSQCV